MALWAIETVAITGGFLSDLSLRLPTGLIFVIGSAREREVHAGRGDWACPCRGSSGDRQATHGPDKDESRRISSRTYDSNQALIGAASPSAAPTAKLPSSRLPMHNPSQQLT